MRTAEFGIRYHDICEKFAFSLIDNLTECYNDLSPIFVQVFCPMKELTINIPEDDNLEFQQFIIEEEPGNESENDEFIMV